jgi:hypothetical protein
MATIIMVLGDDLTVAEGEKAARLAEEWLDENGPASVDLYEAGTDEPIEYLVRSPHARGGLIAGETYIRQHGDDRIVTSSSRFPESIALALRQAWEHGLSHATDSAPQ